MAFSLSMAACIGGCATTADDQQRTIEPPSTEAPTPAGRPADNEFVLSRENQTPAKPAEPVQLHIGDKWWKFRAEHLKTTEAEVKERDNAMSTEQAPTGFWDKQTATETVLIWGSLCNECHGGRRRLRDALVMPAPPPGWGKGDGLFFGNRRNYSTVFGTVNLGGPPKNGNRSPMPAWTGKLAKEQMWALLYFLEFQSGGIEGKFPPSLYPRPLQESK